MDIRLCTAPNVVLELRFLFVWKFFRTGSGIERTKRKRSDSPANHTGISERYNIGWRKYELSVQRRGQNVHEQRLKYAKRCRIRRIRDKIRNIIMKSACNANNGITPVMPYLWNTRSAGAVSLVDFPLWQAISFA